MARVRLDRTLERNQIKLYLSYKDIYEEVKERRHPTLKTAKEFYERYGLQKQTFHKYYRRYKESGEQEEALLPRKRSPGALKRTFFEKEIEEKVIGYRHLGMDRYMIRKILADENNSGGRVPSSSTIYRICCRYGLGRLTKAAQEEKRRIVSMKAGELGHIDAHYLPKGIVAGSKKKYCVVGLLDDYSRICWLEVVEDLKALSVMFALMDCFLLLKQRYGIQFERVLTDNGRELGAQGATKENHPVERLFAYFGVKHTYTRPYRPQTNGKIERFWRTFHEELMEQAEPFASLDALKDEILGYNFYYNEHRPSQTLGGKTPLDFLKGKVS